jgi:hypothetical protein
LAIFQAPAQRNVPAESGVALAVGRRAVVIAVCMGSLTGSAATGDLLFQTQLKAARNRLQSNLDDFEQKYRAAHGGYKAFRRYKLNTPSLWETCSQSDFFRFPSS